MAGVALCMAHGAGSIPVSGSIKRLTRRGEGASRQAHNLKTVGANPTAATIPANKMFGHEGTRPDQLSL